MAALHVEAAIAREVILEEPIGGLYFCSSASEEFARHETVNHWQDEYVRGDVYTNTAENYFSILKPGIYGVYQHVSEAHLHRYVAEFDFRYSNRAKFGVTDGNVRQRPSEAVRVSASRSGCLVKARTKKQKAKRFIAWRKRRGAS
jgi:hypothetical protein